LPEPDPVTEPPADQPGTESPPAPSGQTQAPKNDQPSTISEPATTDDPVEAPNQPPVANPGQTVALPGGIARIDLRVFVSDADGDPITVTEYSEPLHGTVTVNGGVALFTPEPGFFGVETLSFKACDTQVSVFVPPANDILIATNDPAFLVTATASASNGELIMDLLSDSAARLAGPMVGAAGFIGACLLFRLHKVGRGLLDNPRSFRER
jgi:hypothetical protein